MTKLQKLTSYVLYVLMIVTVIFGIMFFAGPKVDNELGMDIPKFTGAILSWSYVLFAIAAVVTIVFSILGIFSSTNGLKNALISIGAVVVLFLISYSLGSSEPLPGLAEDYSPATFKWVDTGLFATYILAGVAFIGIIASEVMRAFK